MFDRRMLLLLLLLLLQVFWLSPEQATMDELQLQANFLRTKIAKQEALVKVAPELPQLLAQLKQQLAANRSKLFAAGQNSGAALGQLQQQMQGLAEKHSLEFVRANWGEPVAASDGDYRLLPLSCTVRGYPAQLDQFLLGLAAAKKFVKLETAQLVPHQKQELTLVMTLVGYQLAAEVAAADSASGQNL